MLNFKFSSSSEIPSELREAQRDSIREFSQTLARKDAKLAERNRKQTITVEVYADMIRVRQPHQASLNRSGGGLEEMPTFCEGYMESEYDVACENARLASIANDDTALGAAGSGSGMREKISGFSRDSRRRLIQKMSQLNLRGMYTSFLTLTYPGVYSPDWQDWKRDLDVFFKWLVRKHPELVGSVWRVEFQKRGAPHFHLILISGTSICTCTPSTYTDKYSKQQKTKHAATCKIHSFRGEIAQKWPDVVRDSYMRQCTDKASREAYSVHYEAHKKAGTNLEVVVERRQVMAYVAKYLGKADQASAPSGWGRTWGFRNIGGELDFSPVEELVLTWEESVQLKRMVKKWLKARKQTKYAEFIDCMANYSVLGLGSDSENGDVAYRMLGGIRAGLLAPHISPRERAGRFMAMYDAKCTASKLSRGTLVETPAGVGRVGVATLCDVLARWRVSVVVAGVWHAFDADQVALFSQQKFA